mmetsp:Transcript_103980/g.290105  ORF Transcript_103980/g.290105 Transcript_103980/m.290105 type:complete len:252 (+) Transcript_103980:53-808(+)
MPMSTSRRKEIAGEGGREGGKENGARGRGSPSPSRGAALRRGGGEHLLQLCPHDLREQLPVHLLAALARRLLHGLGLPPGAAVEGPQGLGHLADGDGARLERVPHVEHGVEVLVHEGAHGRHPAALLHLPDAIAQETAKVGWALQHRPRQEALEQLLQLVVVQVRVRLPQRRGAIVRVLGHAQHLVHLPEERARGIRSHVLRRGQLLALLRAQVLVHLRPRLAAARHGLHPGHLLLHLEAGVVELLHLAAS